jgi:uncharacterized membrane protein YphA (DoxX/SURF4 family)
MNDTGAAGQTPSTTATTRKRLLSIALWVLQVVLAIMFAMAGFAKVGGDAAMVANISTIAASASGSGTWSEPWRSPGP